MSTKQSVIIDDRRNICKKCRHANTCEFYGKYQKFLDLVENTGAKEYLIKVICYVKRCNQYLSEDKEER